MKKNIKRILLSVCVIAMLISCLGGFAYADDGYVQYTVKGGDTVLAICNSLGVDFYTNEQWIKEINKITNYRDIKVGKVLYLPTFNTTTDPTKALLVYNALSAAGAIGATTAATAVFSGTTTTTTTPVTITPTSTAIATTSTGDAVVSYLINHKMQAGETVGAVCAALGVDFDSNANKIKQLSGIQNYYHVPVGKVVVIPSMTAPAGSSVTAIVAHKVKGGETVGSICSDYGLNFGKVQGQLKALNNTDNLNRITVNQTFYLPVPGTIAQTNTTTTTTTTTGTTTPTTTPVVVATHALNKQGSAHGSFSLQVNGNAVTTAAAGSNVKIVATPDTGYKVYTVTVVKTAYETAVAVNSMSFTMPDYDVTVSVTFKSY